MTRVALTDGDGKWFDTDKADKFNNNMYWDGNNNVSMSAGKHNFHTLYRTANGKWVLNFSSQWQSVKERYTELTDREAAEWFVVNEYEDDEIPEEFLSLVKKHIDDLEL